MFFNKFFKNLVGKHRMLWGQIRRVHRIAEANQRAVILGLGASCNYPIRMHYIHQALQIRLPVLIWESS